MRPSFKSWSNSLLNTSKYLSALAFTFSNIFGFLASSSSSCSLKSFSVKSFVSIGFPSGYFSETSSFSIIALYSGSLITPFSKSSLACRTLLLLSSLIVTALLAIKISSKSCFSVMFRPLYIGVVIFSTSCFVRPPTPFSFVFSPETTLRPAFFRTLCNGSWNLNQFLTKLSTFFLIILSVGVVFIFLASSRILSDAVGTSFRNLTV